VFEDKRGEYHLRSLRSSTSRLSADFRSLRSSSGWFRTDSESLRSTSTAAVSSSVSYRFGSRLSRCDFALSRFGFRFFRFDSGLSRFDFGSSGFDSRGPSYSSLRSDHVSDNVQVGSNRAAHPREEGPLSYLLPAATGHCYGTATASTPRTTSMKSGSPAPAGLAPSSKLIVQLGNVPVRCAAGDPGTG
jgi:hypothetical protein